MSLIADGAVQLEYEGRKEVYNGTGFFFKVGEFLYVNIVGNRQPEPGEEQPEPQTIRLVLRFRVGDGEFPTGEVEGVYRTLDPFFLETEGYFHAGTAHLRLVEGGAKTITMEAHGQQTKSWRRDATGKGVEINIGRTDLEERVDSLADVREWILDEFPQLRHWKQNLKE